MVLPKVRMHFSTIYPVWKLPYRQVQRFAPYMILDPVKLTIQVNHHH